eukprot:1932450-Rhodomonas_salina.6
MSGTDLAHGATLRDVPYGPVVWCYAICLRYCYAMSGTGLVYSATLLNDNDLVYGCYAICLHACYAITGTEPRYGGTRVFCGAISRAYGCIATGLYRARQVLRRVRY